MSVSSQNLYVEILTPKVMVLGVWSLWGGISSLIKEAQEISLAHFHQCEVTARRQ